MSNEIALPEVFPTSDEVYDMLLSAVRKCVGTTMLKPLVAILEPVLPDSPEMFNSSIVYRDVGIDGSLELFKGAVPVQQFLGRILYNEDVMVSFIGAQDNNLINAESMSDTRVHNSRDATRISLRHKMPYSPSLLRYLRTIDIDTYLDEGTVCIIWYIDYDDEDMSGLIYTAENLNTLLTIYYKLLTRFPSCSSHQKALPSFRNS